MLVEGEPGIGKSRLLEELGDEATRHGADVYWGRSHEAGASHGQNAGAALDPARADLVHQLLDTTAGEGAGPPTESGRFVLFEAIARLLAEAAARRPVVLLLDDLQWADAASLELVEFVSATVVGVPVLVVLTVRELDIGRNDALVRTLSTVARSQGSRRILLRGVTEQDTAELIELAIGQPPPSRLATAVHLRAEGNPFYVTELARLLSAEGTLTDEETASRAGVPAGVRDVVRRRLARLPEPSAALLALAAVIGRHVPLRLLAPAADLDLPEALETLEPALLTRLLVEDPEDPASFRFAHALVREVVLADVSQLRRARHHLRVADAIEDLGVTDDDAEILAEHLWQALSLGTGARAAAALEHASDVAVRRFAYATAEELLTRAVQLRHSSGHGREGELAELEAVARLAAVARMRHGYWQSSERFPLDRAKELAERTDRIDLLVALLWAEWAGAATACQFDRTVRLSRQLFDLADATEDRSIRATAAMSWGVTCWHLGRITEACVALDEYVALDASARELTIPNDAGAVEGWLLGHCFHRVLHVLAGDDDDAIDGLRAMAEAQGDPYSQLVGWTFVALGGALAGDWRAVEAAGKRAAEADPDRAFSFFHAGAEALLGAALVDRGATVDGLALLERGVDRYAALDVFTILPYYLSLQALGLARAGRTGEAIEVADRAVAVLDQTGEEWCRPWLLANLAEVRDATGSQPAAVAALLAEALAIAVEQGALGAARRVVAQGERLGVALDPGPASV